MEDKSANALGGALYKFYTLIKADRKDFYSIYAYAIFSGLLQLSLPLGIQTIIGFVMAGVLSASMIVLIVLVVTGVFFSGLLQVKQMQVIEKIEQKLFLRYAFEFTDRLPRIDMQRVNSYYLPEMVNKFFDTMSLQKGISKLLLDIPAAFIQLIFGLILLSFYHPVFIAFGVSLFLLVILILRFSSVKGMETNMLASDYKYKVAGWIEEIARTIKTFKYSKGTSIHLKQTDTLTTGYLNARTEHFKILQKQYWSLIAFKVLITAAMLIVGALLLINQKLNIGQFVAAELVIIMVIAAVEKFIINLDKVYDVLTALEKLGKVTGSKTESEGSLILPDFKSGVALKFDNVSFEYSAINPVLRNLSFKVEAGQHIAVMGDSGAGKSTILRLLTGAFKKFDGNILIDEIPIGNYSLQSLRAHTGILLSMQDIFKGSLLENITMGNEAVSLQEITTLAEITGLSELTEQQKEGYDFILDPAGQGLPKKFIQSILVMRALLGEHRLLLLEEPCQHFNKINTQKILRFLKNDTTATIVIATTDETVAASCDKVLLLKNGIIYAQGPWHEVKNKIL
ncbi:ATP-binding cassette domain-containing protein [Panacibacter ginsenosidivorans]|uniref:ATP-binding cassette domain-containing protein n=1 Tax=Panacibacter ginsenosidivorans TaxID=1813871 RepID=A0A5B8V9W0_9BACT|nr:ATP-binding cassette domain-containing protein [Panacibacter ginsenosidivorans]QEC68122.1 ATP-binding cassette domain-containing protein [Panacibacter ginsenosidivorans]